MFKDQSQRRSISSTEEASRRFLQEGFRFTQSNWQPSDAVENAIVAALDYLGPCQRIPLNAFAANARQYARIEAGRYVFVACGTTASNRTPLLVFSKQIEENRLSFCCYQESGFEETVQSISSWTIKQAAANAAELRRELSKGCT